MRAALREAEKAYDLNEVPIGCVIVRDDKIIARGHNLTEQLKDATAHAEMMAITAAPPITHTLNTRVMAMTPIFSP